MESYCFLPSKNVSGNVFWERRRAGVLRIGPGFCAKRQNRDGEGTRSRIRPFLAAEADLPWGRRHQEVLGGASPSTALR